MFLRSNKLEQLEFKLEKLLGFINMQEKLEKLIDDFADLTWHAIYSSIVGFYGNKSTCDDLLVLKLQVHKFLSSELVKYFESKSRDFFRAICRNFLSLWQIPN